MVDYLERKIHVGNHSFQVRIAGEGEPCLLLHGFTGSIEAMSSFADALCNDFSVISLDLPGHGRTHVSRKSDCYSLPECSVSIVHILDQLHIDRCFICGYSMGGRVALAFVSRFSSRVTALATIGASGGIEMEKERLCRRKKDEDLADFIESRGIEAFTRRWVNHPLFAGQQKLGETFLAEAYRQRLNNDPTALAHSLRRMGTGSQRPLYQDLQQLDIPMLFLAGEEDKKFCDLAIKLKNSCPQGCTHFVERAGHAAHLENRLMTAEVIRLFFQQF